MIFFLNSPKTPKISEIKKSGNPGILQSVTGSATGIDAVVLEGNGLYTQNGKKVLWTGAKLIGRVKLIGLIVIPWH